MACALQKFSASGSAAIMGQKREVLTRDLVEG